jgi:hemerythrin-like domain-containing protein
MTPTETLKLEHQVILSVLDAAGREIHSIEVTGKINSDKVEKMIDFLKNFADRCHHAKEEKQLFVRMEERGMPTKGGPIAVMLMEHDEGRRKVKAVTEAIPKAKQGDKFAIDLVRRNLADYVQLLKAHIDKEDNILYPMADRLLTAQDQEWLTRAFEDVETKEMGEGFHERYDRLAQELSKN